MVFEVRKKISAAIWTALGKFWRKRIGVEPTGDLSTAHWI
jgi:hypothetical protein